MAFASLSSFAYQPGEQDFLALPPTPAGTAEAGVRPHVARRRHAVADNSTQDLEAPDDLGGDEERTNPPTLSKRPSMLDLPLPVPPPVRASEPAVAPLAPGPAWVDQASYYPSAPPPTVQPKLPAPSVQSDYGETVGWLENTLMRDPRHLPTLRALSDAAQRQRDVDTAALASAVLVCLQAARPEDEVRLAIIVTDGLPMARRTLNDRDFDDALLSNKDDRLLLETLARLTQASFAGGLAFRAGYEELPKDAAVLDPESSTVTLGRSLGWVGKFLSINTPELVVLSELPSSHALDAQQQRAAVDFQAIGFRLESRTVGLSGGTPSDDVATRIQVAGGIGLPGAPEHGYRSLCAVLSRGTRFLQEPRGLGAQRRQAFLGASRRGRCPRRAGRSFVWRSGVRSGTLGGTSAANLGHRRSRSDPRGTTRLCQPGCSLAAYPTVPP